MFRLSSIVSAVVPPIINSGAFFGGCERFFGVSWIICLGGGKFGLQSILRLQNRWCVFVVGLGFPVWGFGGVLAGSCLTASNCGKGAKSLVTTAAGVPGCSAYSARSARSGCSSRSARLGLVRVALVDVLLSASARHLSAFAPAVGRCLARLVVWLWARLGSVALAVAVGGVCNGGGVRWRSGFRPGFRPCCRSSWLGGCSSRSARRLPFLPVVLWNGCPCCPVGALGSVTAFGRGVFPCGVRLGSSSSRLVSSRCVAVAVAVCWCCRSALLLSAVAAGRCLVLEGGCPSPRFF